VLNLKGESVMLYLLFFSVIILCFVSEYQHMDNCSSAEAQHATVCAHYFTGNNRDSYILLPCPV